METSRGTLQNITVQLYGQLLRLYPPRFQREFAGEIQDVFLDRIDEPGIKAGAIVHEMAGLAWSILRERWHERRTRKGEDMETEHELSGGGSGVAVLRSVSVPDRGIPWLIRWILLPLVILPVTLFTTLPLSLPYQWILNLGTKVELWPAVSQATLQTLGVMTSLGLSIAGTQWLLLRRLLPRPGRWFAATAIGIWLGGIAGVLRDLEGLVVAGNKPDWSHPIELLAIGLILGLTHWLLLRHQIKKAIWFLFIDLIAAISLLPIRIPIDNTSLLIFVPGIISGFGIWFLLRYAAANKPLAAHTTSNHRIPTSAWLRIGIGLALFFFGGLWVNAKVMLENAKAQGAYPTLEEAVIAHASQGWEEQGVKILSIRTDDSLTDPAFVNGKQQHVRWGCVEIHLDRIPIGGRRNPTTKCTQYVHTRDGWVQMGEGFSPFVGWVMELYNLEGVRQFQAGNSQ